MIDGDILCYKSCRVKTRNTIEVLDLEGDAIVDPSDEMDYMMESWHNLQGELRSMSDTLYIDKYVMAVKGEGNFRDELYDKYKGYRKSQPPNLMTRTVASLRDLLINTDMAVAAHGREADDLLRIWSEQARAQNIDFIICSGDKDLYCIPGDHWDIRKREFKHVSHIDSLQCYYQQLLKGDSTDGIPGIYRMGKVTAKSLLDGLRNEEDMQEVVVSQYMTAYGEDWYGMLLINAKLIHLQRHCNDYFTFDDWPIIKELI